MTKGFECPHNPGVTILRQCPITECPFHHAKVSEIFDIPEGETGCVFYDTTLMSNVSASRTQISALSRNPTARISSKAVRGLYDESIGHMRTLYVLSHKAPTGRRCCAHCGYPLAASNNTLRCTSPTVCKQRREWVCYIAALYGLPNNPVTLELIWECFIGGEIVCPKTAKATAEALLSRADAARYELHRKDTVEPRAQPA